MAKGVLFLICFSQKVFYHAHLLGTEVAAVFLITGQRIFPVGVAIFKNKELPVYT